jgi:thiol-disulfide isomerase/thioredoxin
MNMLKKRRPDPQYSSRIHRQLVIRRAVDFRGEESLVLFWNPGCGFCQQMLADLKEWEASSTEDASQAAGGLGRFRGGK